MGTMSTAGPASAPHRSIPLFTKAAYAFRSWGSVEEDWSVQFECDTCVSGPHNVFHRAIEIDASPQIVYRWMCQMRAAPYSYDWIDNAGRQSPRELTPGLERLERGQRFVTIFYLADFEQDVQMTLHIAEGKWKDLFGDVACTYKLVPTDSAGTRIVVKIIAQKRPGRFAAFRRKTFPWGELMMLRRQLLNFKQLAEKQARASRAAAPNLRAA